MRVRLYATLRDVVGAKSIDVPLEPGATVGELARRLVDAHPGLAPLVFDESGALARSVHFMIDGRNARWLDGERTVIAPGQSVDLFPPVAGG